MKFTCHLCLILGLLSLSSPAQEKLGDPYVVVFRGETSKAIRDALKEASLAVELRTAGSVTPRLLRQRAEKDLERFAAVLRDRGHYGFQSRFEQTIEKSVRQLSFHIDAGPRYTIRNVSLTGRPDEPLDFPLPPPEKRPARSGEITGLGKQLLLVLKNKGYPWATLGATQVYPKHDVQAVDLSYQLLPGQRVEIGEVKLVGLKRIRADHLSKKLALPLDPLYREEHLSEIRKQLVGSRLFNYVYVRPDTTANENGQVDILVDLQEQKYRTLFAGTSYQTDRGPGLNGGFEHANVFGRGERARTELQLDEVDLSWKNSISKPDFLVEQQTLSTRFDLKQEDSDAYKSSSATTGVNLARQLGKRNRGQIGFEVRNSRVEQNDEERIFLLYLFPLSVDRNTSDNLLDPQRGYRINWQGAPYVNVHAEDVTFFRNQVSVRKYQSLYKPLGMVAAGRVTLGTLGGAALHDIPADERFYAGGGGSLRGYRYQSAGTLDEENNPVGGRSLLEASLELRTRIVGNLGMTLFYDAGRAGESALPGEGEELLHAAGGGLRYHTPIGPVRADIGFPLDRRPGVDKSLQFYISLGQSF